MVQVARPIKERRNVRYWNTNAIPEYLRQSIKKFLILFQMQPNLE